MTPGEWVGMSGVTRHTDNNTKPGEMCVKQLTVRGLPAGQGIGVVGHFGRSIL
jgi:hypothetical protein